MGSVTGSRDEAEVVGYRWVVYECVCDHLEAEFTAEPERSMETGVDGFDQGVR